MMYLHGSCVVVLLLCHCTSALIVPEEIVSLLSVVYSNIPPIRKGTDSRVGVGFRLGNSADVQFIVELGPQIATQPLGPQRNNNGAASTTSFKRQVEAEVTRGGDWLSKWRANVERRNAAEATSPTNTAGVQRSQKFAPNQFVGQRTDPNRLMGQPMLLHLRKLYQGYNDIDANNITDSNVITPPSKSVLSFKTSSKRLDDVSLDEK